MICGWHHINLCRTEFLQGLNYSIPFRDPVSLYMPVQDSLSTWDLRLFWNANHLCVQTRYWTQVDWVEVLVLRRTSTLGNSHTAWQLCWIITCLNTHCHDVTSGHSAFSTIMARAIDHPQNWIQYTWVKSFLFFLLVLQFRRWQV